MEVEFIVVFGIRSKKNIDVRIMKQIERIGLNSTKGEIDENIHGIAKELLDKN
ncbi:MAG: hypothetical protein ACI9JN_002533 [Bacteroidia bacterium]|jgi:hypothetical protein